MTTPEQVRQAAALIHERGGRLFIALNEAFYGMTEIEHYAGHVRRLGDMGVDGVIVCSVPLLLALQEAGNTVEVCLSTLQPVFNTGAVKFFKRLGIDRIVFPEHTVAGEVDEILADESLKCENFFWLSHDCVNVEAHCLFHHQSFRYLEMAPGCEFDYCRTRPQLRPVNGGDSRLAAKVEEQFAAPQRYKINGMGNLYDYGRRGLHYLKMGNRPMPLEHKLLLLRIARGLIEMLEGNGLSRPDFVAQAHEFSGEALRQTGDPMLRKMYPWYFN